jgi:ABC-type glutathione transport system ATPase component
VLEVSELRKEFGELSRSLIASFAVPLTRSLAIVGESGSGKTTIARMIVGLERPTAGSITACGRERSVPARSARERRRRGSEVQIVFQDPYTSLDPRQTAEATIDEVLKLHHGWAADRRKARIEELIGLVGLDQRQARALPRALSGGQRQRVAIARALAAEPRVLILDESVAALDVSIQAQVLNLLADIRDSTSVSYVLISHDLAVVRQLTDDAIVLHRGVVVEEGPTARSTTRRRCRTARAMCHAATQRRGTLLEEDSGVVRRFQHGGRFGVVLRASTAGGTSKAGSALPWRRTRWRSSAARNSRPWNCWKR